MSKRYYQKSKEPHEKYQNLSEEEKNKILSKLYWKRKRKKVSILSQI